MTILEILQIAIPALTGIATILRIISCCGQSATTTKNNTTVVVVERRQQHKKSEYTIKPEIRNGSEFDHCTHIEI
jgi:hypothetical protein